MNISDNNVRTEPGIGIEIGNEEIPSTKTTLVITGTNTLSFENVKHLLSDKPLRRPSRVRPIDNQRQTKKKRRDRKS